MTRSQEESTSFSLIADIFKEFGEEDLLDVDKELLEVAKVCLGTILQYCNACLYKLCQ